MKETLKWDDLKVGDTVATHTSVNIGWKTFRHGIYTNRTIRRITPKRRYVVMEDGTEWKKQDAIFYAPSPELERENEIAKAARQLSIYFYNLEKDYIWTELPDDEIINLHDVLRTVLATIKNRY